MALSTLVSLALVSGAMARTLTVHNNCAFTIWPAMYTDMNVPNNARPDHVTGWEAAAGTSETFTVPDNWQAGRIWGRRDCDFSTNPGPNSCLDGGCNGGLECALSGGTGVPPASLAEFTFDGNNDNYDVSMVDGYNLPLRVDNDAGCPVPSCTIDLAPICPEALKGPFDASGAPVGCKTACTANLDGNPGNSPNCCSGDFDTPQTCPSSGVQYYDFWKQNCPDAYAYAYDESSGSALWTCVDSKKASYTVTFCP